MMTLNKYLLIVAIVSLSIMNHPYIAPWNLINTVFASTENESNDKGDQRHAEEEHEETGRVRLTPEQMKAAGIIVTKLSLGKVVSTFTAPGEIQLNDYRTVKITPRISAQIIERHARLGENVEVGQPLVTLSSVEMAEAEGALQVAEREWQRVKSLGREVVSEKRYTEAKISRDQARARVHAYGMSSEEIDELLDIKQQVTTDGTFSMMATLSGRVLHDDFIIGERVEPGRVLMVIADESIMWVEARVSPADVAMINPGNSASVLIGSEVYPATVSQIHHTLDETTRTLAVRLEVNNPDDNLHPGQFVKVNIQISDMEQVLTVPEMAVLRSSDGDWQVLVEQDEPGEFKAVEIRHERVVGNNVVITGLAPGTPVVTQGAFFIQSELAKAGFEIHNH